MMIRIGAAIVVVTIVVALLAALKVPSWVSLAIGGVLAGLIVTLGGKSSDR